MSLATTTDLERRIEQLEHKNGMLDAERRKAKGLPTREQEQEEALARIDSKRLDRETPAAAFVRQEIERQKHAAESWLSMCGVPADADDSLKEFVLSCRDAGNTAAAAFVRLAVLAGDGKDSDNLTYTEVVSAWPKMKPKMRAALQGVVFAFQNQAQGIHN